MRFVKTAIKQFTFIAKVDGLRRVEIGMQI
jgi:hypothetical protein